MPKFVDEGEIEQLLDQLTDLRSELYDEVISLKHVSEPVELDQQAVGRVSRGDALQQQNMAKANLGQCQERIRQVEDALHKIDAEEYGICEECGEPISMQRLHAQPETPYCIKCQTLQEQRIKT